MARDNHNAKAARTAAAQARSAAEAAERARDRKVRLIGSVLVVIVMAAMLIPAIARSKGPATNSSAVLPKGVDSKTYGLRVGPAWTAANADKVPTLSIWEDFQCTACGSMEQTSGAKILELAAAGKIKLEWRPTIFIDDNAERIAQDKGIVLANPKSSYRASLALGCAADQGFAEKFHSGLFAIQPTDETVGYSNGDLTTVAQNTGMSSTQLTSVMECLTNEKYKDWVNNSFNAFSAEGNSSTPTAYLNGTELSNDILGDPAALEDAINKATTA